MSSDSARHEQRLLQDAQGILNDFKAALAGIGLVAYGPSITSISDEDAPYVSELEICFFKDRLLVDVFEVFAWRGGIAALSSGELQADLHEFLRELCEGDG